MNSVTVNEVSKRKSISRTKLKAASQEERIHMWKEHFKNMLGKSPKVTDKLIMKIINNQLEIKLEQFLQVEFKIVQTKIKNRKAASLIEVPSEVRKTRKFDEQLFQYCHAVYN